MNSANEEIGLFRVWFSKDPLEEPTILKEEHSKYIIGAGVGALVTLVGAGFLPGDLSNRIFTVIALLTTAFIYIKVWTYYYGYGSSNKINNGLFKKCEQVNARERSLDYLEVIIGALLIPSALKYYLWFTFLILFYFINLWRCYETYHRSKWKEELKKQGKEVPQWYDQCVTESIQKDVQRKKQLHKQRKEQLHKWMYRGFEYIFFSIVFIISIGMFGWSYLLIPCTGFILFYHFIKQLPFIGFGIADFFISRGERDISKYILLIIFLNIYVLAMLVLIKEMDLRVLDIIRGLSGNYYIDHIMLAICFVGNIWIWIFVTSVIIWTGYRNRGYLLGTLLLVDIIISTVLKVIIAKPRPPHSLVIAHEKTFSMPSGHAERISAVGTFLSNLGRRLTYIFVIIIFLVCFSRVYLGVHYPSDIFAGLIIGTILGYCALRIEKKRIPITNFHRTVLFFAAMLYALVSYLFISEYKILLSFASFGFFVGMLIESNFQLISSPSEKKKLMGRIFLGSFGLTLMMWIYSVLSSFILKAIMASFIGLWITLFAPILFKKFRV